MKTKIAAITAAAVTITAWTASATVVVLGSSDAQNGPISNGSAPISTTTSQAFIGSGSWQANGTSVSQEYLYKNTSAATQDGLGQLKVSDLSSLSFSTLNNLPGNGVNWFLTIYTVPTSGSTHFYGNRLVMEPYLSTGNVATAGQWNTWSTAAGPNQLTINDTGGASGNLGFTGQPTLADLQSGSINWSALGSPNGSATLIDYADMDILGIVLSTGNPWANGFTGDVDDVNINTTHGDVTFDLEAVPEPSTYLAGALLLLPFGFGAFRALRKQRATA